MTAARTSSISIACLLLAFTTHARAGCAGAFCLVNTDWSAQGAWVDRGWRADLRYELVQQNRLMRGSRTASAPGTTSGAAEHGLALKYDGVDHAAAEGGPGTIERSTRTHRLIAMLDYGLSEQWGLSVAVPVLDRVHSHDLADGDGSERWVFRRVGDVRLLARYQSALAQVSERQLGAFGLHFGLKLPTGPFDVRNADGALAERALQPGTGTTDLVLGAYLRGVLPELAGSWFAQLQVEQPLNSRDAFRPGARLNLDLGYRHEWSESVGLLMQLNAQTRGRDRGDNAEPELSGGRAAALSPGVSVKVGDATQVYAFAQLPIHQYVNGTQLAPRWAATLGVQTRF